MATPRERAAAAGDADALNRLLSRKPAEQVVWLATDDVLLGAWREAKEAEQLARSPFAGQPERLEESEKKVAAAEAALTASGAVRLVLRNTGRDAYQELLELHPPTEADHKTVREATGDAKAIAAYNLGSFRPALVALAVVDPAGLTAEMVAKMVADGRLSNGELLHLANVAQELHTKARVADLGK